MNYETLKNNGLFSAKDENTGTGIVVSINLGPGKPTVLFASKPCEVVVNLGNGNVISSADADKVIAELAVRSAYELVDWVDWPGYARKLMALLPNELQKELFDETVSLNTIERVSND